MTALFEMYLRMGGDPRSLKEFIALREELTKSNHPAWPDMDWDRVEHLCLALFQKNGVDLQTVAAFIVARSHSCGVQGMAQGLELLQSLTSQWSLLWPATDTVRRDIEVWLFTHLQSLLRSLDIDSSNRHALASIESELLYFGTHLQHQSHASTTALHALREWVATLLQRSHRPTFVSETQALTGISPHTLHVRPMMFLANPAAPLLAAPLLTLSKLAIPIQAVPLPAVPKLPVAYSRTKVLWLLALLGAIVLGSGFWSSKLLVTPTDDGVSLTVNFTPQRLGFTQPIRLDSLSLFDAGSAELKLGSTKLLVNALIDIKAQPGWLIVITGHTDASGSTAQNLSLSKARAMAVRDWMQRMGDLPDNCFAIHGAADSEPIDSNDTQDGRTTNRRVDIRLMPQAGACLS